jgi:beta-lactamase regulating signal transducer with metallopeptidase domain
MERLITYLLQSVLVSGMLMGYYRIVLRNRRLHGYNRRYLLGTMILSLVLPLVPFHWVPVAGAPVLGGTAERVENISRSADNGFHWVTVEMGAAMAVSAILLYLSISRLVQVFRLKEGHAVNRMQGYDLIETDDPRAPFSFFNNLFWRRGADPLDPVNRKILYHELAHIGGRHSWDGLFAQVLASVFWMNPFFWLIRRELSVVHEFIADAATGMEGDPEGFARMLLQSVNEGQWLAPVQGFFQSPIKRRLVMISGSQNDRFRRLRMFLIVPVVVAATLSVACTKGRVQPARLTFITLDTAKLAQEQRDLRFKKLALVEVEKKKLLLVLQEKKSALQHPHADSIDVQLEPKRLMELSLQEVEKGEKPLVIKDGQ